MAIEKRRSREACQDERLDGSRQAGNEGVHQKTNTTSGRTLTPMMGGGAAEEVRYTAFLLDEDSRLALLGWASEVDSSLALPPDWTTRADHLTIWHRPTPERMAGYDLCGFRCELRVLGLAKDHRALAVHVEVPDFVPTPDAEVRARPVTLRHPTAREKNQNNQDDPTRRTSRSPQPPAPKPRTRFITSPSRTPPRRGPW